MRWVLLVILVLALPSISGVKVAFFLADPEDYWSAALAYFNADPRFDMVFFLGCGGLTPELSTFQSFDVVFYGGWTPYFNPELFGDRLADYVDSGGHAVGITLGMLAGLWTYGITGRWEEEGYCPYRRTLEDWCFFFDDLVIDNPEHPIFDGVGYVHDSCYRIYCDLRAGAAEVAHFSTTGGVAVNADQTAVGINIEGADLLHWTGDGYLIMANAACWLAAHSDVREISWGRIKAEFE
jgi:hypothetical protein